MSKELKRTFSTTAVCPRCGYYLRTTDIQGYGFVCTACDENYYCSEVKPDAILRVSMPIKEDDFIKKLPTFRGISKLCGCNGFHYNTCNQRVVFHWDTGECMPSDETMYKMGECLVKEC